MFKALETVLPISGLRREVRLLQITDLHLIHYDERDARSVEAMGEIGRHQAEWFPYGAEVLESLQAYLRQERPDCVVFTGDILGYPSQRNMEVFRELLYTDCPRYLYVFGNHDRMFTLDDLQETVRREYTRQLSFAVQGDPALQVIDLEGVRLIGLDNSDNQISPSQEQLLMRLMEQDTPCLLFMHVPLYLPELEQAVTASWGQPLLMGVPERTVENMLPELTPTPTTARFAAQLRKNPGAIRGIFAGHIHFFDREDTVCGDCRQVVTPMAVTGEPYGTGRLIRLVPGE